MKLKRHQVSFISVRWNTYRFRWLQNWRHANRLFKKQVIGMHLWFFVCSVCLCEYPIRKSEIRNHSGAVSFREWKRKRREKNHEWKFGVSVARSEIRPDCLITKERKKLKYIILYIQTRILFEKNLIEKDPWNSGRKASRQPLFLI